MRFLALCLCLAACTSDPCLDASCVTLSPDAGADAPAVDVGDDRMALPDFGPRDTGYDAGVDVVDVRELVDRGAADVGVDVPVVVDVADVPAVVDVPVAVDVPVDAGVRPLCTTPRLPCRVHADCAACVPMPTLYWCCTPDDPGPTICLPGARPCG